MAITVSSNGSFLRTDILPRFGYFPDKEALLPTDSLASKVSFYSSDAHLIDLETTISTNAEQTAIAPGYLQKHWTENGRNYFQYKTDQKIKLAAAFNSGIYNLKKETYKGIELEVYHHPNHYQNIDRMMDGLKAAIDYNSQHFSPYQHREARIIEFPLTEGSYATTMANSIPTSEWRFVLNNASASDKIDLSFYVPAHELTHQWWGNQVIPANARGAKMLTESITEYITLQLYKGYYGQERADQFLEVQKQRYLHGRRRETPRRKPTLSGEVRSRIYCLW